MRVQRERDAGVDFARAAAMLGVIMIHVTSGYVYLPSDYTVLDRNLAFLLNQLSRFSVPLFLLLSGVSLCANRIRSGQAAPEHPEPRPAWDFLTENPDLPPAEEESLTQTHPLTENPPSAKDRVTAVLKSGLLSLWGVLRFYLRRFGKLLPPYWFWTTFYFLFGRNFDLSTLQDPHYVRCLLMGCAGPHLYFVVVLAQCYLLFPLLQRWTARRPDTCLVTWSLCLYAVTELIRYRKMGLPLLRQTWWPYLGISILLWGWPFILGMVLAEHGYDRLRTLAASHPVFFPTVWLLTGILCALEARATGSVDTDRLSLFLFSALSFPALLSLWAVMGRWNPVGRASSFLARRSMTIYFCHVCVLTLCRRRWRFAGMRGFLRLYFVVTALSVAAAALLDLDLTAPLRRRQSGEAGETGETGSAVI